MASHVRVASVDANGNAAMTVPPLFWAGGDGFTSAQCDGAELGTVQYASGTMPFVEGVITFQGGTPNGEVTAFLWAL